MTGNIIEAPAGSQVTWRDSCGSEDVNFIYVAQFVDSRLTFLLPRAELWQNGLEGPYLLTRGDVERCKATVCDGYTVVTLPRNLVVQKRGGWVALRAYERYKGLKTQINIIPQSNVFDIEDGSNALRAAQSIVRALLSDKAVSTEARVWCIDELLTILTRPDRRVLLEEVIEHCEEKNKPKARLPQHSFVHYSEYSP